MAYEISLLTTAAIMALFALSLNLITGFCGQISLGHAAFLGIGAYTSAMLCRAGVPFLATLPLAMLFAGLLGLVVGLASLRVRDDFMLLTALLCVYLRRSWMGRVFNGIAEDEDTMRVLGVDVPRYKLAAFAIGTMLAGLAGALYSQHFRYVGPESFGFVESITVGSVPGVMFGAALLSVLPAWFQFIGDYKLLVYGGLLFLMMRFSPSGVAGLVRGLWRQSRGQAA